MAKATGRPVPSTGSPTSALGPSAKVSTFSFLVIYLHVFKLCLSHSVLDLFVLDGIVRHGTRLAHLPAGVLLSRDGIKSGFNAHGEV